MHYRLSKYLSQEDMIMIQIDGVEKPAIIKKIDRFEGELIFDCYYINDKEINQYLVSYFPDEYVKYIGDYRQMLNRIK